jgi:D-lactate dehydrogenase
VDVSAKRKGASVPNAEAEARLLLDFDGSLEAAVEADVTLAGEIALEHRALDVLLATDAPRRRALWDVRRGIGEAVRDYGFSVELVLGVPRSALVALVTAVRRLAGEHGLSAVTFGHAADGNMHVHLFREDRRGEPASFAAAARAIYEETARLGGTVAAEHGVGVTSRDHLALCRTPATLAALAKVKDALDPNGILNPGKLLPR